MRTSKARGPGRSGAAAVEMAFCIIPLFMLLFGIFEYGRYMMDRNLLDNAVRAACRLAVAHNTDTALLGPASTTGNCANTTAPLGTVTDVITTLLGGRQQFDFSAGPTITITGVQANTNAAATFLTSPTTNAAASNSGQLGVAGLGPGDSITVSVTATYRFIFPLFIYVPSTVPMNSSVTMLCEGGN